MTFAIVLILIVLASVLFHLFNPWQATPVASNWGNIDTTLAITFLVCGLFFVVLMLFMAWALIRYRHHPDRRADYQPENPKLENWLILLTSVGIAAMLAPGLFVYGDFVHPPANAAPVEVLGQQWRWSFRFPGKDGELGTSGIKYISFDNPFGLNPDDPKGQDDVLINDNELHLPQGQPIKALLRSRDVLHDFYVPEFRAKMDLIPGTVTWFWMTPTQLGSYDILCAELCGVGHYNMRGKVVVESDDDFQQWLSQHPTFAQVQSQGKAKGMAEQGRQLAESQGCLACHSTDGSKGLAPTWKNLYGSKSTLSDGSKVVADEAYLKQSITQPNTQVVAGFPPVMVSYALSEEQLSALIAYIKSLSESELAATQSGGDLDAAIRRGATLAQGQGCTACHSLDGSRGVGPSWRALYGRVETLADGSRVQVDADYLKESISNPGAKVVQGYPLVMQAYAFNSEQLGDLIALIQSLSDSAED